AVAWTARLLGEQAVIYMPAESVNARVEAIRSAGAEVILVEGSYDDCVVRAQQDATAHGWQVVSDTSYEGYTTIPRYIMAGYTTMFREIDDALSPEERDFDFVFVQAGVGSLLAAAAWYYSSTREKRPRIIAVEPTQAACVAESIRAGGLRAASGSLQTIMAGLNCGSVSLIAWPFIENGVDAVFTLSDDFARQAMRAYYHPMADDPRIISGESGAAGLAALLAIHDAHSLRRARTQLGLDDSSRVLLVNTEGDTDPENFQRVARY
ncbi:MAG: diaminopropionate ammonia-lyase, partial [bacterium]